MTNAYSDDIEQFNQNAASWWDPNGAYKTLHQINPLRLNFMLEYTAIDRKKILDVGCGGGILSESLCALGAQVKGIDLAKKTLEVAQKHAQDKQFDIDYQCCSVESLIEKHPQHYDVICCMEMLEHVPEPEKIIAALAQLCKPGGWVFISTINRNALAWLGMIVVAEKILKWLPEGTHNASHFIKPEEVSAWAKSVGMIHMATNGLVFDPIHHQFKRHKDRVQINYVQAYQMAEEASKS